MPSFAKIKSTQNGEITLSFTDLGKLGPRRKSLTSQICLLTLFAKKIKFCFGFTVVYDQNKFHSHMR